MNKIFNRRLIIYIIVAAVVCAAILIWDHNKGLEDGEYAATVTMEGGSGRATMEPDTKIIVKGGQMTATVVWSSSNYDYMIVNGEKITNENPQGQSTFTIPVEKLGQAMTVIGDTTAMSVPHEIEYKLTFELKK